LTAASRSAVSSVTTLRTYSVGILGCAMKIFVLASNFFGA
jgi:hypothetical protein